MNQAMFTKVFIDDNDKTTAELREPFDVLLSKDTAATANRYLEAAQRQPDALDRELQAMYNEWVEEKNRALLGAAVGVVKTTTPQLKPRGLSIELLVGVEGLEPPTLSRPERTGYRAGVGDITILADDRRAARWSRSPKRCRYRHVVG